MRSETFKVLSTYRSNTLSLSPISAIATTLHWEFRVIGARNSLRVFESQVATRAPARLPLNSYATSSA